MRDSGLIHMDVVVVAESEKFLSPEQCIVVSDDGIWDAESINDVSEECHSLLRVDVHYGSSLDPLGILVGGHE
jgi:hypothetical protein